MKHPGDAAVMQRPPSHPHFLSFRTRTSPARPRCRGMGSHRAQGRALFRRMRHPGDAAFMQRLPSHPHFLSFRTRTSPTRPRCRGDGQSQGARTRFIPEDEASLGRRLHAAPAVPSSCPVLPHAHVSRAPALPGDGQTAAGRMRYRAGDSPEKRVLGRGGGA